MVGSRDGSPEAGQPYAPGVADVALNGPDVQPDRASSDSSPPQQDSSAAEVPDGSIDRVVDGSLDGDGTPQGDATAVEDGDGSADGVANVQRLHGSTGPTEIGRDADTTLNALSGIGVSRRNPGVLYAQRHATPRVLQVICQAERYRDAFTLQGRRCRISRTWRSHLARREAACTRGHRREPSPRTEYAILRTPEPSVASNQALVAAAVSPERLVSRVSDGVTTRESLLLDPSLGATYVITKVNAGLASAVYRLPAVFGAASVAAESRRFDGTRRSDSPATSANVHPCMAGFLLRTGNTFTSSGQPVAVDRRMRFQRRRSPFPLPRAAGRVSPIDPTGGDISRPARAPGPPSTASPAASGQPKAHPGARRRLARARFGPCGVRAAR